MGSRRSSSGKGSLDEVKEGGKEARGRRGTQLDLEDLLTDVCSSVSIQISRIRK